MLEESNTANILLCLSVRPTNGAASGASNNSTDSSDSNSTSENQTPEEKLPSAVPKGNIIDQLRQKVRAEAADAFNNAIVANHSTTKSATSNSSVSHSSSFCLSATSNISDKAAHESAHSNESCNSSSAEDSACGVASNDDQTILIRKTFSTTWINGQEIDRNLLSESPTNVKNEVKYEDLK